jgi:hypothetical protein
MAQIVAENVVASVIQDQQTLTTNRTALYDYVDRIHQRILLESQWRFLLSDPQVFITIPGVSGYSLVSGSAPAGVFQTNLNLSNFGNIAPGTVFNLTSWTKIEEDSDSQSTLNYILNKDGSLRSGYPRTYANSIANPGVIFLKPVPDNQNLYYPVPETPVVTYAPLEGCTLPNRIYFGVATFVDSLGGEGTQCAVPFTIAVPGGSVLTVESPNPSIGGIAGNQVVYGFWNLYIGYAMNSYNRQNVAPIAIGTNWTESNLGINTGVLQVPSVSYLPPSSSNTVLSITSNGILGTTNIGAAVLPSFWAIKDSDNVLWQVTVNGSGFLETVEVVGQQNYINVFSSIYLTDTTDVNTWVITVDTSGNLHSAIYSTPPSTVALNSGPPMSTPTIQPISAYVIQFRYYQTRNQITSPSAVLQIPYAYNDVVIAGVNYLASRYTDRWNKQGPSDQTFMYKKDFEDGLAQIRRDLRVSFRKTDFIAPDQATQYVVGNQQGIPTMGW